VKALDIEFRGGVVPGVSYEIEARRDGDDLLVTLAREGHLALSLRAERGMPDNAPRGIDLSWTSMAGDNRVRNAPAVRSLDDLRAGLEIAGAYETVAPAPDIIGSSLPAPHARVLALCSYITGMELPGLKSLFTRATVRFFRDGHDAEKLLYRARVLRFDRQFRILDTELTVATPQGIQVAAALLRSYVPFSPAVLDLPALSDSLHPSATRLRDKVALVVGGSRGLGADLTAALALAGCHVYFSARHEDPATHDFRRQLEGRGARTDFLRGDAADPAWCASALDGILRRHGRIDLLVLAACAQPAAERFGPESA
jgi:hypothetical protein